MTASQETALLGTSFKKAAAAQQSEVQGIQGTLVQSAYRQIYHCAWRLFYDLVCAASISNVHKCAKEKSLTNVPTAENNKFTLGTITRCC